MASAVLGGALSLGGALISSESAGDAAGASANAANQAAQVQWNMYNQSRADMAPWREAGAGAVNALWGSPATQGAPIYGQPMPNVGGGNIVQGLPEPYAYLNGVDFDSLPGPLKGLVQQVGGGPQQNALTQQIVGYGPGTPATTGLIQQGPGEFTESPSYQFALQQGLQGQQRAASATGRLGSGAYLKDATRFAEGLASQEYGNFLNRYYQSLDPYFRMAGLGSNVSIAGGQQSAQTGNALANTYMQGGQAQAAGILGQSYPWAQLANYGANQLGQYAVNQQGGNSLMPMSQYWSQSQYTPAQMNSMSWL